MELDLRKGTGRTMGVLKMNLEGIDRRPLGHQGGGGKEGLRSQTERRCMKDDGDRRGRHMAVVLSQIRPGAMYKKWGQPDIVSEVPW